MVNIQVSNCRQECGNKNNENALPALCFYAVRKRKRCTHRNIDPLCLQNPLQSKYFFKTILKTSETNNCLDLNEGIISSIKNKFIC